MKARNRLSIVLCALALFGAGCKKDSDDDGQKVEGDGPASDTGGKDHENKPKTDDQQGKDPKPGDQGHIPIRGEPLFAAADVTCTSAEVTPAFCMNAKWQTPLNVGSESQVILTLVTLDRYAPSAGAEILDVIPWMPEHGHGQGDELTVIRPVAGAVANQYLVTNVQFIMPGRWELRTKVKFNGQDGAMFFPVEVP